MLSTKLNCSLPSYLYRLCSPVTTR
uniref:Uncharacterized protein n=1 Tax=Anguilla anguilla TaxID=7936 RepID=A0A0E9TH61_ANGAN